MLDPQPSRPLAAIRILERMLRDRESGSLMSLERYEALFPGSETLVREEWQRCVSSDAPPATLGFGRYEVIREIASGGQATVYEAKDAAIPGRRVALKVLRERSVLSGESTLRFAREVEVTARLDHPGVCPIHDFGEHEGRAFIAMRLVEGETLAVRFARHAAPGDPPSEAEVREALAFVEKVARVVHVAHTNGVVHRDLKPSNIMVGTDGEPVVLDFGLAHRIEASGVELTRSGDFLGTPAYMAPEQIDGRAGLGPATDVHALGIVLYEWLARVRPFTGPTALRLSRALLDEEAVPIRVHVPGLSKDLELVLATALAKDPAARYGSAAAFADDLQRVREVRPIAARRPSRVARLRLWVKREPWLSGLTGALILTVSIACFVFYGLAGANAALLTDYERLADRRRLEALLQEAENDLVVSASAVPAFERWHQRANALVARLPEHQAALSSLRRSATEVKPAPPDALAKQETEIASLVRRISESEGALARAIAAGAPEPERANRAGGIAQAKQILAGLRRALAEAGTHVFVDESRQWVHDQLQALVAELEAFQATRPSRNTTQRARIWGRHAQALLAAAAKPSSTWENAIARVRTAKAYGGLALTRQEGLEPLGPDPESGLEEFAATVPKVVPVRDPATGRLTLTRESNVVFVLVPGGTVTLDGGEVALEPFFLGKHELTQAQYAELTQMHTSTHRDGARMPDGHSVTLLWPLESETWIQSERLMRRFGWTLPTEAQWEHACRAGSPTRWHFGERLEDLRGRVNVADATRARFDTSEPPCDLELDDGHYGPAPVGTFPPNRFGLFEMHGNVAEWCLDAPRGRATTLRPGDGLRSGSEFSLRVARGGSFADRAAEAASGRTRSERPDVNLAHVGIRPARKRMP